MLLRCAVSCCFVSRQQAHVAPTTHVDEVQAVVAILLENNKIRHATHPAILAYRIAVPNKPGVFHQDYDDDGEAAAGGRLLHLLQAAGWCWLRVCCVCGCGRRRGGQQREGGCCTCCRWQGCCPGGSTGSATGCPRANPAGHLSSTLGYCVHPAPALLLLLLLPLLSLQMCATRWLWYPAGLVGSCWVLHASA